MIIKDLLTQIKQIYYWRIISIKSNMIAIKDCFKQRIIKFTFKMPSSKMAWLWVIWNVIVYLQLNEIMLLKCNLNHFTKQLKLVHVLTCRVQRGQRRNEKYCILLFFGLSGFWTAAQNKESQNWLHSDHWLL